jgi:hypothetical protein
VGLSPFQYLRNKLDGSKKIAPSSLGKSSGKQRPSTAGGVVRKDLSKENSTETKRTAKTGKRGRGRIWPRGARLAAPDFPLQMIMHDLTNFCPQNLPKVPLRSSR